MRWILAVMMAACSGTAKKKPDAPPAAPRVTPTTQSVTATAPAPPAIEPPPACATGDYVQYFERDGDHAVACLAKGRDDRSCWKIDATLAVTALPRAEWPPSAADIAETKANEHRQIEGGDTWKWKVIENADAVAEAVEVCPPDGGACKRVPIKHHGDRSISDVMVAVVSEDGATVALGRGFGAIGNEATELYDVASGRFTGTVKIPKHYGCAEPLEFLGGNLIVQLTDCANDGGERLIITPRNKRIATLAMHSTYHSAYPAGGGGAYWLFPGFDRVEIWDVRKGKRLASYVRNDDTQLEFTTIGDSAVSIEGDGKIIGYTADLAPERTGAVPRCD